MTTNFTVLVERTAKWLCLFAAVGALAACGGGGDDLADEPAAAEQAQPAAAEDSRAQAQGVTVLNRAPSYVVVKTTR